MLKGIIKIASNTITELGNSGVLPWETSTATRQLRSTKLHAITRPPGKTLMLCKNHFNFPEWKTEYELIWV